MKPESEKLLFNLNAGEETNPSLPFYFKQIWSSEEHYNKLPSCGFLYFHIL